MWEKLFLLQARPITPSTRRRQYESWTRDNVADVIPDAVTPLTWSLVRNATNNGYRRAVEGLGLPHQEADLFQVFEGKVYFNQTSYHSLLNTLTENKQNIYFLFKFVK